MDLNALKQRSLETRPSTSTWRGEVFNRAEIKMDGYRVMAVIGDHGISLTGRKHYIPLEYKVFNASPTVKTLLSNVPPNTILDGELYVPGGTSSDVASAMTEIGTERLVFQPFAIPVWKGEWVANDLTFQERDELLWSAGFHYPKHLAVDPRTPREELLKQIEDLQVEGLVLKLAPWLQYGWFKLKPKLTLDAIIIGCDPGSSGGRNEAVLGNLMVALYDGKRLRSIGSVGKGFTDVDRARLWADRDNLIGKVIEVSYEDVTTGQKLRFSSFLRFRPDKPASECLFSQLADLSS